MTICTNERELAALAWKAVREGVFLADLIQQLKDSVTSVTNTETKFLYEKGLPSPLNSGFGAVTPRQAEPGAAE